MVVLNVQAVLAAAAPGRVLRLCLQGIGTTKEEIIINFVFLSTL